MNEPRTTIVTLRVASLATTRAAVGLPIWFAPMALIVAAALAPGPFRAVLAFAVFVSLGFLVVASFARTRVRIGADAVDVSWLGHRRRVWLRDVRSIERTDTGLRLALSDGSAYEIRTGVVQKPEGNARLRDRDVLHEHLTAAHLAVTSTRVMGTAFDAALLDPAGRDVDAWIAALRALGRADREDYRSVAVDPQRLYAIATDPHAPAMRRAAALLSTASNLEARQRIELRDMALGLLDADLRAAIEAILAADDRRLRAAMLALGRAAVPADDDAAG